MKTQKSLKSNISAQWVSVPLDAYFPKEISARDVRWLQPCGTQGQRNESPGAHSLDWGYNVAASRVHYSLFSPRAHQNDFSVTNHSNEMEPSQQILKASGVKERCSPPPQPLCFWCRACMRKSSICIKTVSCQGGWGHGLGWFGLGWQDQMFGLSQCNFQLDSTTLSKSMMMIKIKHQRLSAISSSFLPIESYFPLMLFTAVCVAPTVA